MEEIKTLPTEEIEKPDKEAPKTLPTEYREHKKANETIITASKTTPKYSTQTISGKDKRERISNSTKEGGLKGIPDNFNDRGGDWDVINSGNPFEVLYLDYEQHEIITMEMVERNYEILKGFWEDKISAMTGAAKTQIVAKYGGEHGTEKTVQNYQNLLNRAYEKIKRDGIRGCFREIDGRRQSEGEKRLLPAIQAVLSDGKYEPVELKVVLETGYSNNLKESEIKEYLISNLRSGGFQPVGDISTETASTDKLLSITWTTEEYKSSHSEKEIIVEPTISIPTKSSYIKYILVLLVILVAIGGYLFFTGQFTGTGSIIVHSTEAAKVFLNGKEVGITNMQLTNIKAGSYDFYIEVPDFYKSPEQKINIKAGEVLQIAEGVPDGGVVTILSSKGNSNIEINGKLRGTTPLTVKLPVGKHVIKEGLNEKTILIQSNSQLKVIF